MKKLILAATMAITLGMTAIPQTADAGWLRAIRWLLEPTVMGDGTPKAVNVDSFATHGIFVGIQ